MFKEIKAENFNAESWKWQTLNWKGWSVTVEEIVDPLNAGSKTQTPKPDQNP